VWWRLELVRVRSYRLVSVVAALPLWLVATGHAQGSGAGCSGQVIDNGCEMARKSSPDGGEGRTPIAAAQPIVTYSNGKLTVVAWNATLAEVLHAISAQTGIAIDFPAGSAADRIVVREGPGTTRQVLTNLLNGSDFNYVILGSPDRPDELTRVVLAQAGQEADFSSQPANDQKSHSAEQTKTIHNPLLWTPPKGSSFWTPPKEDPAAVPPRVIDSGNLEPPKEPIPPDVLEQMMKERTRELREQVQQQP
jgi:hypothetical protein